MTVKEGDIVFVTESHLPGEYPGVVLQVLQYPTARIHIFGSPHGASTQLTLRQYEDDVGFREANEPRPTGTRPKPVVNQAGTAAHDVPQYSEDTSESETDEGSAEDPEADGYGESLSPPGSGS